MAPPLPSLLFLSLVTARLFNAFDIISYPFLLPSPVLSRIYNFSAKIKVKFPPQFFFSQFSLPVLQLQRFSTADYYRAKGRTFFPKKKRVCIVYTYIYIRTQYLFIPRFRGENRRGTVKLSALPCENIETRGVFVCPIASHGDIAAIPRQRKTETVEIVRATGGKLDFACFPAKHLAWSSARSSRIYSKT